MDLRKTLCSSSAHLGSLNEWPLGLNIKYWHGVLGGDHECSDVHYIKKTFVSIITECLKRI